MRVSKEHKLQQSRIVQNNKRAPSVKQLYRIGNGDNQVVTVQGLNNVRTFQECLYNFVEYDRNDNRRIGTGTQNPALWAGCVKNAFTNRNATQLHIVNMRWGGLGGRNSGNIIPGTPALNRHHYLEAEREFDHLCFGNGNNATDNWKYECWAKPSYGRNINLLNRHSRLYKDPELNCLIRRNGHVVRDITVTKGRGLYFISPG